jgi:TATA-binding protein-associated factor Taf7
MEQYQDSDTPRREPVAPRSEKDSSKDELKQMRQILEDQHKRIDALERIIKKTQNELREAINAFNRRNG